MNYVTPFIFIVYFGSYVGFAGAATTDENVRVDMLTPNLPLFWHLRDVPMTAKAAKTFAAAQSAPNSLNITYARQEEGTNNFPYLTIHTPEEEAPDCRQVEIKFIESFESDDPTFIAKEKIKK
ncbi:hypothetical protein FRB97_005416 [Tulasnella sp. 331]|nr:hypothetical protein FRB97_005416 [Tulasnella sp. 331]